MRFTLVADGASDAVLMPILTWSLRQHKVSPVAGQWADLGRMPRQPNRARLIESVVDLYPCDVLFVHRDAESQSPEARRLEIAGLVTETSVRHVPVVPVRMTEAWLLFDEKAIRWAASNPNGSESLGLPELKRLEELVDPKQVLHEAIVRASGLNARRRSRFPVRERARLVTNYIDDYSRLNALHAFRLLQEDIRLVIAG